MNKQLVQDAATAHVKAILGEEGYKHKDNKDAVIALEKSFKDGAQFLFENLGLVTGSPALALAVVERTEQIHKHGKTLEYDRTHNDNEQLRHAACALIDEDSSFPNEWQEHAEALNRMYEKEPVQVLIYAASFLIAEADRLTEV